ncbi:SPFH domain-containing protein [Gardnerella vaginalis]|uniref:SPFH domain-containing protein n=1 Tax=Gardnerella vaginalis TaxID=2702 RepID=UPI00200D332C|nr:SPFH domain-containing protein [Gardnerella vaginalis]UQA80173.1 SPFH domain-containing protein [Gardnerella vaginalis]
MDEIRCDEPSYLIWKWRPSGSELGENNRENAIRFGSSLRVKDGEVAVFVYNQKNGIMQDFIVGPFDQTIKTDNLPVLASIVGLAYKGGTPFQAEVYFINLAQIIQVKFAVPFFDVYDPRFVDFGVPVAVRGTISFSIKNYQEFIKLHRLNNFSLEDFTHQICDSVNRYIKNIVTNAPTNYSIPVIQLETRTQQINDAVEHDIKERLETTFGVMLSAVDVGAIEIDKTSDGYKQLMRVTKNIVSATAEAEAAAHIKNISDKQQIEIKNYEETLRVQREEGQYAQHKATQSTNIGAFQIEKQAEVGVAGANALGQMGENGAGNINLGDGGLSGFNPAAMMASMAVGGVVGNNIAGAVNNIIGGINQPIQSNVAPPPIPTSSYYIAVNGKPTGPFNIPTLMQMATSGQFTANDLVWKNGMEEWQKAAIVDELKSLFNPIPPIPNQGE